MCTRVNLVWIYFDNMVHKDLLFASDILISESSAAKAEEAFENWNILSNRNSPQMSTSSMKLQAAAFSKCFSTRTTADTSTSSSGSEMVPVRHSPNCTLPGT